MVHALPGLVSHRHRLRRYDQGRPRRQGSRASGQRGRQVVAEADPPHRRHAHEGRDAGGREEHRSLAEKAGPGKGRRTEKGRREERVKDVGFFVQQSLAETFFPVSGRNSANSRSKQSDAFFRRNQFQEIGESPTFKKFVRCTNESSLEF